MKRLKDHADGKLEKPLDQTQIKAYEVLLDRLLPKLSAVEQTTVNDLDAMGDEEMESLIRALITANPGLIAKLGIGLRAVEPGEPEAAKSA